MDPEDYRRIAAEFESLCDADDATRVARLSVLPEAVAGPLRGMLEADAHTTGVFGGVTGAGEDLIVRDLVEEAPPERVGDFTITGRIGRGGMGVVYEAQQAHPRRKVALKTLHPWLRTARAAELFRFEVQALGDLHHPGIPQVYAAGEQDGFVYLAMELVRGLPLDVALEGADDAQRIEVLARLCDAVHHAHQAGILHRDLKPANVLLTTQGQPKVLDFGIASSLLEGRVAQASGAVGTIAYCSPEQLAGRPTDVPTDVYALGVIGYQLFTGVLPHAVDGLTPAQAASRKQLAPVPMAAHRRGLPDDLAWVLDRALEAEPGARYDSVAAMAADLRRVLRLESLPSRSGMAYRARLGVRRHRGRLAAAAGLCAFLAVGGGLEWQAHRPVAPVTWELGAPPTDDPAAVEVWRRAEALAQRGQVAQAAESLHTLAMLHEDPRVRAAGRNRAERLGMPPAGPGARARLPFLFLLP
ncbi:MAG: serine/threonine protein kinase [Deltaproteobacteria bacterium]|nr:MAG: serine/threonine protein kinase [Deltaproteobacteria bacterium]